MKNILKSRQSGFAIIEALIAFLLLGIGVAALLYLQGNLMSGSSTSKARAEAIELAKDRTEMLRNFIDREQYLSALGSVPQGDTVDGINATYTVNYTILQENAEIDATTNPLTIKKVQNLTVKVSWTGSESDSEEVALETMLYFMSPAIASAIASGNSGDAPFPLLSPFITGVEGVDPNPPPSTGDDGGTPDVLLDNAGNTHTTLTIKTYYFDPVSGSRQYGNVEVIGTDGKVKLTSFGGIVHKLQGEIIIDSGANTTLGQLTYDLKILASPPSYCVFPICVGGNCTGLNSAKYVCYVPGDCTYGSSDEAKTHPETTCPDNFAPPTDDDFEDLNGGWYGRVGNFGVAIHPDDKVCTFETDVKSILTPSRSYVKYRCKVSLDSSEKCPDDDTDPNNGNGNIIANEGVNRPYSNQDFFITRKNQSCPSGLVTSRIEGTPMVGEKNFNRDTDDNLIDDTWEKNVVLSKVACDTDPTSTDPSITDGSCLHP